VYYDEYHRALRAAVDAARVAGGILIDIHGAAGGGAGAADLYLGTLDGASARGVWRDGGFGTALVTAGYTVFPPASGVPELAAMRGGYTTQRYGRHNAGGIDAVQVEITQSLRFGSAARESVARALARGALAHLTPHNVG
jgi:N-formylglutamate amidohydrolase